MRGNSRLETLDWIACSLDDFNQAVVAADFGIDIPDLKGLQRVMQKNTVFMKVISYFFHKAKNIFLAGSSAASLRRLPRKVALNVLCSQSVVSTPCVQGVTSSVHGHSNGSLHPPLQKA